MKTYDYRGSVIKEGNKTTSIAYVQCQVILINTSVPGVSERICQEKRFIDEIKY